MKYMRLSEGLQESLPLSVPWLELHLVIDDLLRRIEALEAQAGQEVSDG